MRSIIVVVQRIVTFALILFSLSACDTGVIIDMYQNFPKEGWSYSDTVKSSFVISKKDHYHDVIANLRVDGDYAYSNIYINMTIIAPDSSISGGRYNLQLAEKSGKWRGSGFGDVINFHIPVLTNKVFEQEGKYTVYLTQDMRENPWPHVLSAGIKVQQKEEIF